MQKGGKTHALVYTANIIPTIVEGNLVSWVLLAPLALGCCRVNKAGRGLLGYTNENSDQSHTHIFKPMLALRFTIDMVILSLKPWFYQRLFIIYILATSTMTMLYFLPIVLFMMHFFYDIN